MVDPESNPRVFNLLWERNTPWIWYQSIVEKYPLPKHHTCSFSGCEINQRTWRNSQPEHFFLWQSWQSNSSDNWLRTLTTASTSLITLCTVTLVPIFWWHFLLQNWKHKFKLMNLFSVQFWSLRTNTLETSKCVVSNPDNLFKWVAAFGLMFEFHHPQSLWVKIYV